MATASSRSSRRTSRSGSVRPKRLGVEQPRIFTPPLRKLTRETSLGFAVIEFSEQVLELELLPWQKWLLVHALELLPSGALRFRTVVVLVARQNGKSLLSQVLALWFMYVYGYQMVLGTAQDLDVAEEIWQGAVDIVEETPELDALKERVIKVNGKKSLELSTGQRYKVKAASRRGGRGLTGDLILLDELREHQTWDAWGAITKTTMARDEAQVWALSNAGDAASIVLAYLRKMGHAALGDPDGLNEDEEPGALLPDEDDGELELDDEDTLGLFEWSVAPGVNIWDRDGWAQGNPALGHTITERTIASAAKTDPEWIFRTEVMCQWSSGSLEGPFPPDMWENGVDEDSRIAEGSALSVCVDVSWDRTMTHIAVAGYRGDGMPHVEVIASRAGTDWPALWLAERPHLTASGLVMQTKSAPAGSLVPSFEAAGFEITPWGGTDLGAGCGALYDRVRGGTLKHLPQPVLDVAAATAATRPATDSWVWDRKKSATDIAPLVAVTGALWGLERYEEDAGPSVYEERGLVVV